MQKTDLLKETVEHIDLNDFDPRPLVDDFSKMAFQARNLARACEIFETMVGEKDCSIILTMAGSLISSGMKKVIIQMMESNMVDAIVSTGANIVDMDFFEALGYRHYIGTPYIDDNVLREFDIDRIYDTFIDEEELRECDFKVREVAMGLEPRPYSSREFIYQMGRYLDERGLKCDESIIHTAYKLGIPIFVPAFSDCSAGFGLMDHQRDRPDGHVSIDSVRDFRELVDVVLNSKDTGILMIGGGVPKNFVQDAVLGGEVDDNGKLVRSVRMHKYAIQITVADERDGALSGSTLREASSWGKVETTNEQMVFAEATLAFPLLAGYSYHSGKWKKREPRNFNKLFTGDGE